MAMAASGVSVYMNQFLDVASKGRVKYMSSRHGQIQGKPTVFHMFRCTHCLDNLHLAEHVISSSSHIPQELQDWVLKHRHICSSFKLNPLNGPNQKYTGVNAEGNPNAWNGWCASCGWPSGEHLSSPGYAPKPIETKSITVQEYVLQQLKHPANQHITSANFKIKEMMEAAKQEAEHLEQVKQIEELKKMKAKAYQQYQEKKLIQSQKVWWDGKWNESPAPVAVPATPEPKSVPTVPQHTGRKFR